jgi:transposase-like protein
MSSRKADGRRFFSTEFKRDTVQRVLTGEKTVAELSRELDIAPECGPQLEAVRRGGGADCRAGQ